MTRMAALNFSRFPAGISGFEKIWNLANLQSLKMSHPPPNRNQNIFEQNCRHVLMTVAHEHRMIFVQWVRRLEVAAIEAFPKSAK